MYEWRAKARMILCACAEWSDSAQVAHSWRHFFFARRGQNYTTPYLMTRFASMRIWTASSEKVPSNMRSQIILRMRKVSSGLLLSIHTFCSIQWFCLRTVKVLIRLRDTQAVLGLRCQYMPRDTFSDGAVHGHTGQRNFTGQGIHFFFATDWSGPFLFILLWGKMVVFLKIWHCPRHFKLLTCILVLTHLSLASQKWDLCKVEPD